MYLKIETVTSSKNCNVAKIGGFYGKKSETVYYIHPDFYYLKDFLPFQLLRTDNTSLFKNDPIFQKLYVKLFDADTALLPETTVKVKLTSGDREILEEFSTLAILNGVKKRYLDCILELDIIPDLKTPPYFLKSNMTSGKNSNAITPVTTREAAAHKLLTTVEWNSQYAHDDSMAMFFIPWRDFEEQFEFRIFVYRKRIITLCSQKWFKVWDFTDNFIQKIEKALNKFQTDFVDTFEHENYSANIYVYERHQGIHLIEVNPWGNSGPGLFSYEELATENNFSEIRWKILSFPDPGSLLQPIPRD